MKANGTKVRAADLASPKIDLPLSCPTACDRQLVGSTRSMAATIKKIAKLTMKMRRNSPVSPRRGRANTLLDLAITAASPLAGVRIAPQYENRCAGTRSCSATSDQRVARPGDPGSSHPLLAGLERVALGAVAQLLGGGDADQERLGLDIGVEKFLGLVVPWAVRGQARRGRLDLVHLGAERQDIEKRVEQRVAVFLHDVGGPGIAHERRARGPADDGAGEGGRDEHAPAAQLGGVHPLVERAVQDHRRRRLER